MEGAKEKGTELNSEDLDKVSGGFGFWGRHEHKTYCAVCGKEMTIKTVNGCIPEIIPICSEECYTALQNHHERIPDSDLEKVSGGVDVAQSSSDAIWKPKCPKCGKEMPGGMGVVRVDGTIYEHPYFCENCANSLTQEEKNK